MGNGVGLVVALFPLGESSSPLREYGRVSEPHSNDCVAVEPTYVPIPQSSRTVASDVRIEGPAGVKKYSAQDYDLSFDIFYVYFNRNSEEQHSVNIPQKELMMACSLRRSIADQL
jgi:hypothetical protein